MPSTMMHLLAGRSLLPGGTDAFYLGCILPDCVDADRQLKDHLHFRDLPPENRLSGLTAFAKTLSAEKDFHFGVIWHLYLDYLWDIGPQKAHREAYHGNDWFHDYRREIRLAGSYISKHSDWALPLWERMKNAPHSLCENSFGLCEADICTFLDYNYRWHTETDIGPSTVFTPELITRFTAEATRDFRRYLAVNFPNAAVHFTDCGNVNPA